MKLLRTCRNTLAQENNFANCNSKLQQIFKIVTIINRTDNIPLTSEVKGVALNEVSQRRAAAQLRRIDGVKLQLEEFLW